MDNHLESFKQFMKQREIAARAYLSGDPVLVENLATHVSPATFFGPRGGYFHGADAVIVKFNKDATNFTAGSDTHFEILDMNASDSIAYWVGLQRATVHMVGMPDPIPMDLRVTEIFHLENNEWKMVHRHADMLVAAS